MAGFNQRGLTIEQKGVARAALCLDELIPHGGFKIDPGGVEFGHGVAGAEGAVVAAAPGVNITGF